MSRNKILGLGVLLVRLFAVAGPAAAQLQPAEPDPLARLRAAANDQAQVCTTTAPSACALATPKIVASAIGPSPLAENLRLLNTAGGTRMAQVVTWAVAAFRAAGVDKVHTEQTNVVAEIRGREKPGEFVMLGATLGSELPGDAPDSACNAALVIEAARDIRMSGLRPLRSIRFVLFGGEEQPMSDSRTYVRAHRAELDGAIAAVIFDQGCGRVTGFSLGGRPDIESGVREAFSVAPVNSWDISRNTFDAPLRASNFDFLLEGVPNLLPNREADKQEAASGVNLSTLQRNTAVAGVLAFALAEHPTPLGPRLSRAGVAALLQDSGLDEQMKAAGLWPEWESTQRGRQP